METKRWSVLAGSIAVALAGCGGGGGGDAPLTGDLTVTAANQETVSRSGMVALQACVLGGSAGVTAGGGGSVARALALAGRKRIAAVQPPVTELCSVSGSTTTVYNDVDGNNAANPGDTATITYNACSDVAGEVTNGVVTATYTQIQLSTLPASIGANLTTTGLSTQSATASVSASGGFSMLMRIDSATAGTLHIAVPSGGAFAMAITTPLYSDTVTLRAGYALDSAYDGTALPPGGTVPGRTTTTASGPVASATAAGYVQVTTLQPFVQYDVDPYPRSGRFQAVGKTGSVQAVVQSSAQVQIDLDADGNGSFEASKTVAWSDFF